MYDVFLSYARNDSEAARKITQVFEANGLRVFQDHVALVAGESWQHQTAQQLASARAVVVLLSSNSKRDRWVEEELTYALERSQLVVPVLLDDKAKDNWVWPLVSNRQAIALDTHTSGWERKLDELSDSLLSGLAQRPASSRLMRAPLWLKLLAILSLLVVAFLTYRLTWGRSQLGADQLIELFNRRAEAAMTTPPGPQLPPSAPLTDTARIVAPEDSSEVPSVTLIRGTVSDPSVTVWVVVHPVDTSSYWVQPRATNEGTGWSSLIFFGRQSNIDAGKRFEVRAFVDPRMSLREGEILSAWPEANGVSRPITVVRAPDTR